MKGILTGRETDDLLTDTGGIMVGETDAQTAEAVITAMRGEFKELPLLGGEVARHLGGTLDVMWAGNVREMLRACGVDCQKVTLTPEGMIDIT